MTDTTLTGDALRTYMRTTVTDFHAKTGIRAVEQIAKNTRGEAAVRFFGKHTMTMAQRPLPLSRRPSIPAPTRAFPSPPPSSRPPSLMKVTPSSSTPP